MEKPYLSDAQFGIKSKGLRTLKLRQNDRGSIQTSDLFFISLFPFSDVKILDWDGMFSGPVQFK